jgi:hypothetical protein
MVLLSLISGTHGGLHAEDHLIHQIIHPGKQEVSGVWLVRGTLEPQIKSIGAQDPLACSAHHDGDGAFFHESLKHFPEHRGLLMRKIEEALSYTKSLHLYTTGHLTSAETSTLFTALGIAGPSSRSCDRLPKLLSAVWESQRERWEDALRQQEVVPAQASVVAVSLDGVMVPDKDAQREAKATREAAKKQGLSQQLRGPAGYREVGCGTVTLYDEDANRLDTVRYGRAPEAKKKTWTAQLEAALASILAVRPDLEGVALADGAEDNWRYFERPVYENATKIVDYGHASQPLRAAMTAYYGEKTVTGRAEYARLRILLRDQPGGADDVIAELSRLSRKMGGKRRQGRRKLLNAERTYFQNQRDRLDDAGYQARGLPMGSGMVEAACKTLATQRLKRSGMSWRDGKPAILTMRSLQQSHRWPAAWALLSAHFRVDVIAVRKYGHLRELTPAKKAA